MPKSENSYNTLLKPKVVIDKEVKLKLLNNVSEKSQVILHCSYTGSSFYDRIRIWKSTFLFAKESNHQSKLIHCINIPLFPEWLTIKNGETINFTLIFSGLPNHCKTFDMIEKIPEPGGFEVKNIQRNKTDIYNIVLR